MNWILVLLITISSVSFASISSGTLHRPDAVRVEGNFTRSGYSSRDFDVNIARVAGTTDYYLAWPGITYNTSGNEFTDGVTTLGLSVIAVANAIDESNWTPTYLFVGFDNIMLRIRANRVVYFASHYGDMPEDEAVAYLIEHSVEVEYAF